MPETRFAMVVDDDPGLRTFVGLTLESLGYRPVYAASAFEACAFFERRHPPFSLFLLDQVMPDMSGAQLIRWLRSRPETEGAVILTVSGVDATDSLEAGADHALRKPYDAQALITAIETAIAGRQPKA